MRAWVLLLLLAGCAGIDAPQFGEAQVERGGEPTGEVRGADEYWLVRVTGDEVMDPQPLIMCGVAWAYDIEPEKQAIHYSQDPYVNNVSRTPSSVIATGVFGAGDCPVANGLVESEAIIPTDGLGGLKVTLDAGEVVVSQQARDGWVRLHEEPIVAGETLRITGGVTRGQTSYWSDITVEVVGAWPVDGFIAA